VIVEDVEMVAEKVGDVLSWDVPDAEGVVDVVPTSASLEQTWLTTSFEFKVVVKGIGSRTGAGIRLEHCFVTLSTACMTPWTQAFEHAEEKSSFVQSDIVALYARLQPGRSNSRAEAWKERS